MIVGEGEIHIKDLYYVLMKNGMGNAKQCKTLIKHQKVYVNNKVVTDSQYQVCEDDHIICNNVSVNAQPFLYYMMNKPKGYICANHDLKHSCVIDIIKHQDCFCVGRLDKDTTGLLFITNDPSLSKRLLLPSSHIKKVYQVTTRDPIHFEMIKLFEQGVIIDQNTQCLPAKLLIEDSFHCQVTIYEGKYHQIKKMFLSCGNQVIELKRIQFHHLILDETLAEGEYRSLTQKELQYLLSFDE